MEKLKCYKIFADGRTINIYAERVICEKRDAVMILKFVANLRIIATFYNVTGWVEINGTEASD